MISMSMNQKRIASELHSLLQKNPGKEELREKLVEFMRTDDGRLIVAVMFVEMDWALRD